MNYKIISLENNPIMKNACAKWFHEKWGVPIEAYMESMNECLTHKNAYPQWYVAMDGEKIIGGLGVIENDFHDRKDLFPNVCAVYVEEEYRCNGIAGKLLDFVCDDMRQKGLNTLYLVTDHTSFYERYGWQFYCYVQGDGEEEQTRLYIRNL